MRNIPVGGRLSHFLVQWQNLIQDRFAKSVVKNGYHIDWLENPPPLSNKVIYTKLHNQGDLLQNEVQEMLQKGAIEQVQSSTPGYYSTFFLVPKKDTDQMRPVINLKALNKFVLTPTFKMHSPQSIIRMLTKDSWLASIDLKDAYFHVPMHPRHYKFLRFAFRGMVYQFKVLPFGLSTAPRVFTKVLAPVVGYLHQHGIHLYPYLDDCLLVGKTKEQLLHAIQFTLKILTRLEFLINQKKSQLLMTQQIQFLGMNINTKQSLVSLPKQKAEALAACATMFLPVGTYLKARHYLRFLGLMASTLLMVPRARLYMRPVQVYLNASWNRKTMSLDYRIMTPLRLVPIIQWWSQIQNLMEGISFPLKKPSIIVTTDASLTAWGAHCGSLTVQGKWKPHQQKLHINLLELMAVWNALKAFRHKLKSRLVLVQTDNTSVLHYINNSGGTKSILLCQMTWDMLHWCINHNIELKASHIPGKDNLLADKLSRKLCSHTEWELKQVVANQLFHLWPMPMIDLFASHLNTKLDRFCSLHFHPRAENTDALAMSWRNLYAYAFPPFPILAKVLEKVRLDRATLLLVAPNWTRREWYPLLLDLLVDYPRQLPLVPDLISQNNGSQIHPDLSTLMLVAWKVSGDASLREDFLNRLQKHVLRPPLKVQGKHMDVAGQISLNGVEGMISIPILQMFLPS
jgi:ribonuclease HI